MESRVSTLARPDSEPRRVARASATAEDRSAPDVARRRYLSVFSTLAEAEAVVAGDGRTGQCGPELAGSIDCLANGGAGGFVDRHANGYIVSVVTDAAFRHRRAGLLFQKHRVGNHLNGIRGPRGGCLSLASALSPFMLVDD